jgi:hypothetical protein
MKEHILNFLNNNRDVIFPYIELIQSIFPFLLPVCLALANNQILSIVVKDKNLQGFVVTTAFICLIAFVIILILCAIVKKLTPVSDKDEQIEILQTRIVEISEENRDWVDICYETIDALLHSLASGPLKFGENGTYTERISLYIHDEDFQKFIQLGRVSLNPDYCKLGKRVYAEDEGCLGYTWNNGEGFRNDYADPETDLAIYLEQMKHESLNKNVVKAFNMKSRLYYGYRVMDTKSRNCLAVIIVESTDPSRYSKEELHKVFGIPHRAFFISRIIEKLYPCLPKLQNAREEGF